MDAYRAGHVCLSLHMIQLKNRWTDSDDILKGSYAIGGQLKLVRLVFLQPVIPRWRTDEHFETVVTLVLLNTGAHTVMNGNKPSKSTVFRTVITCTIYNNKRAVAWVNERLRLEEDSFEKSSAHASNTQSEG
jgi:hypothetical protein